MAPVARRDATSEQRLDQHATQPCRLAPSSSDSSADFTFHTRPGDDDAATVPPFRGRIARIPLGGPEKAVALQPSRSAPASPRSSPAQSPISPLRSSGGAGTSRSLQAFAQGTTMWVDPNELQLDISLSSSALRKRRMGRRAHSERAASNADTTEGNQPLLVSRGSVVVAEANAEDEAPTKAGRRAARSLRLQGLLAELGDRASCSGRKNLPELSLVQ